jgi:hypothetical protein
MRGRTTRIARRDGRDGSRGWNRESIPDSAAGASIAASLIGWPAAFNKVLAGAALVLMLAALGFQVACFFAFGPQQATLTLENATVEGIGRLPGSQSPQIGFQTRAG